MRAARRCCSTVSSINASVTKKIIVAMMLICGGIATRAAPHTNSGNVIGRAGVEVRDHEIVDRQREREQRRGQHARARSAAA